MLSIHKYFEVQLDPSLPYDRHVEQASSTVGMRLNVLYWSRRCLSEHNRKQVVQLFLLPIIDYRDVILSTATTVVYHLGMQYNKLCRSILSSCDYSTDHHDLYNLKFSHCWRPVWRNFCCIIFWCNCMQGSGPAYLLYCFNLSFKLLSGISPIRDWCINKHLFSQSSI